MPPPALPFILRPLQRTGIVIGNEFPPPGELHRDVEISILPAGNNGPGFIAGPNGLIDRQLAGEEVQEALLHGVALVVAVKFQLHNGSRRAWRR